MAYSFTLGLPEWAIEENNKLQGQCFDTVEKQMALIIRFSNENIERNTGGPFAAAIFERVTGKLVVCGVNRVMAYNVSKPAQWFTICYV